MKTILVVDDEARIRRIYKTLLSLEGYNVMEAPAAVEANEVLKKEDVDLVLLDIRMPEVEGNILWDVIGLFHRKVKVIVSSVYHVERQKRIVPYAADYYDKSQGLEVLLCKIGALLDNAPGRKNPNHTRRHDDTAYDYMTSAPLW